MAQPNEKPIHVDPKNAAAPYGDAVCPTGKSPILTDPVDELLIFSDVVADDGKTRKGSSPAGK
jgi:hypothetical protein